MLSTVPVSAPRSVVTHLVSHGVPGQLCSSQPYSYSLDVVPVDVARRSAVQELQELVVLPVVVTSVSSVVNAPRVLLEARSLTMRANDVSRRSTRKQLASLHQSNNGFWCRDARVRKWKKVGKVNITRDTNTHGYPTNHTTADELISIEELKWGFGQWIFVDV